jgi:hypothetical protein
MLAYTGSDQILRLASLALRRQPRHQGIIGMTRGY